LEIYKVINNLKNKEKPKLNITIKDFLYKQIIISIGSNNIEKVMAWSNIHITNINRLLKNIKSKVVINFIKLDNKNIIIITNKVVATLDLNVVKKYIKNLNNVNSSNVMSFRLPQSKSYLKTLDILYLVEDTTLLITH